METLKQRPRFDDLPDVLHPSEAAAVCGVSQNTIRTLCMSGTIKAKKTGPGYGMGTRWLIPKRAIIDWLEAE